MQIVFIVASPEVKMVSAATRAATLLGLRDGRLIVDLNFAAAAGAGDGQQRQRQHEHANRLHRESPFAVHRPRKPGDCDPRALRAGVDFRSSRRRGYRGAAMVVAVSVSTSPSALHPMMPVPTRATRASMTSVFIIASPSPTGR